ncbi:MAG: beta strand repeat-containing protein, partial [Candidatus Enterenecus sp.]
LWLNEDFTTSETVNVLVTTGAGETRYYMSLYTVSETDGNEGAAAVINLMSAAVTAASDGGRIKLVNDLVADVASGKYLSTSAEGILPLTSGSLTLDLNGHTLGTSANFNTSNYFRNTLPVIYLGYSASTPATLAVENSAAGEGVVEQLAYYEFGHGDTIQIDVGGTLSLRDVTVRATNDTTTDGMYSLVFNEGLVTEISNCKLEAYSAAVPTKSAVLYTGGWRGAIEHIDGCTLNTDGVLIILSHPANNTSPAGNYINLIENTTMTSTGTGSEAAIQSSGTALVFGKNNTVTVAQDVLFNYRSSHGLCNLTFTSPTGSYETTAEDGTVYGAGPFDIDAPDGKIAADESGAINFVDGYTVRFLNVDGSLLKSVPARAEESIDPPMYRWYNNGLIQYTHTGWSENEPNGTPVDFSTFRKDADLYPIREETIGEAALEMSMNGATGQYLTMEDAYRQIGYAGYAEAEIKLLTDLTSDSYEFEGHYQRLTIDLNGYTLTVSGNGDGNGLILLGYYNGSSGYTLESALTIKDSSEGKTGVLTGDETLTGSLIYAKGDFTHINIEGGTLSSSGPVVTVAESKQYSDAAHANVAVTISNATLQSSGGAALVIQPTSVFRYGGTTTIVVNEGAVLEGAGYVIELKSAPSGYLANNNPSIVINGGQFKGATGAILPTYGSVTVPVTYPAGLQMATEVNAEGYYTLVPIPLVVDNDTGFITGNAQSSVDENGTVTVDASAVGTDTVTLSADTVATLESGNSLTVTTGTATVAFNAGATADIAAQTGDVVLSVKDVTEGSTHTDAKAVYDLSLTSGGTAVTFTGSVDVTIPFTGEAGKGYVVYYYDAGGNKELVPASFGESSVTFTTTHFSEFGIEEQAGYTLEFRLPTGADKHFDAGETITAELWVSRAEASQIRSYQFTLTYDDTLLTLGGITLESAFNKQVTINGAAVAGNTTGEGVTVGADGVKLGTVTFTVNSDVTEGATDTLDAANVIFSHALDNQELAGDVAALDVTLHNLSVTLKAGTNSTINGGTDDVTLYAKYGQTGLYSDPARTVPVNSVSVAANIGYRLADNNWIDENSTEYADFNTIKGQTFTDTTAKTYTLQTVAQYIITIGEPVNAALTTGSNAPITVDAGTLLSAAALPTFTPNAGYAEDGWYVNDTKVDPATYAVNGNITVVYKATAETFAFAVPDTAATGVTVTTTGGVTDGTVSYGTNVTGTISSDDTALITGVTVTIGGVETTAYAESNGDGTWTLTIPGTVITGNIEIEAATLAIHTVTFSNGAGVETLAQTAYVVDGRIGYYTTVAALKNGTVDFTVPVPVASAGYRLSVNLWKIGETEYTNSEIVNKTYTDDAAIVAQAVQQWTVTFAAGANGALADGAVTSITVDNGTTVDSLLQYLPATKPDAGYVFDQWTWNPTGTAITGNTTVTASFKDGSYPISFPTVSNVTVAATGGVTDGQATHGTDVTFTVVVGEGANVTKVSYSVNGTAVELTPDASGVYTIPGSAITGPVSVLIESNATYQITFAAGANGKVDGGASVTKTFDANHLLTDSDLPTVQPDAGYVFDQWVPNPVGMTVTGAATYTATFKDATYSVDNNGTTGTVTHGENYTFTPAVEGQIVTDVTVTIGGTVVTIDPNPDGSYTIPGDAITGNVVITYTSITAHFEFISYDQYAAGISGKQIAILVTDKVADGSYSLTGYNEAYYSVKYGGYVWFVNDTETEATLSAKLSAKTGAATELTYEDGDLNGSGTVTAADAGIINDVLHQNSAADSVSLAYTIGDKLRFELDVMGDKSVTTKDIMWILYKAVGLPQT